MYSCKKNGLEVQQELFITPDENLLVWDVTLTNTTQQARQLDLTGYTELAQMKWVNEQLYGYYWRHMLKTWKQEDLLCYLYQFREGSDYFNAPLVFYGSNEQIHSFSTDRNAFVGNYRDESDPQAVENHCRGNETMLSGEPCFALQVRKNVKAGETVRICWFLGVAEDGLEAYEQALEKALELTPKGATIGWENRGTRMGAPTIGNQVYIGVNASVVGKITIGDDVMIGPGALVNFDVPSHSVVLGNPGVIHHKDRATELYIRNLV